MMQVARPHAHNSSNNHNQLHRLPHSNHQKGHHNYHLDNNHNNYNGHLPWFQHHTHYPANEFFQRTTSKPTILITTKLPSINISVITKQYLSTFFITVVLLSSCGDARIFNENNPLKTQRIQRAAKITPDSAKSTSPNEPSTFSFSSLFSKENIRNASQPDLSNCNEDGTDSFRKFTTRPQLTKLLISTLQKLNVLKNADFSCILLDKIVHVNSDFKSSSQTSNIQHTMTIYMYFRELHSNPLTSPSPTHSAPTDQNVNVNSVTMLHLSCISDPIVEVRRSNVNNLKDIRKDRSIVAAPRHKLADENTDKNKLTNRSTLTAGYTGRKNVTDNHTEKNKLTNSDTDRNKLTDGDTDKNTLADSYTDGNKVTDSDTNRNKLTDGDTDINKLTSGQTDRYKSAVDRNIDSSTTSSGIENILQSGVLSRTQIVVISTCSTIIGMFCLVAGFMRVRNYIKRYRLEQELARRPKFRSCSVALRGATHSIEQLRRDSLTSRSSNQVVPRCLLTKKAKLHNRKTGDSSQGHPAETSTEEKIYMDDETEALPSNAEIPKTSTKNGRTTREQIQGSINPSFSSGSISYQLQLMENTPNLDQKKSLWSNIKSGKKSKRKNVEQAMKYNQSSNNTDPDERRIALNSESRTDQGLNTSADETDMGISHRCTQSGNILSNEKTLEHLNVRLLPSFVDKPPIDLKLDLTSSKSELQNNPPDKMELATTGMPTFTTQAIVLENGFGSANSQHSDFSPGSSQSQLFGDFTFVSNHNNDNFGSIGQSDPHNNCELNTPFVISQNDSYHKCEDSDKETQISNTNEVCGVNNVHPQVEKVETEPHCKTCSPLDSDNSDIDGGTTNTDLFTCSSLTSIKSSVDSLESDEQHDVVENNKSLLGYENSISDVDLFTENSCLVDPPVYDSSV